MKETEAALRARGVLELLDRPWCIHRATLQRIAALASAYMRGELHVPDSVARAAGPAHKVAGNLALSPSRTAARRFEVRDGVAVLPLRGVITARPTWLGFFLEETAADRFNGMFADAMADPEVRSVLLAVDSPGGESGAAQSIAQRVFGARGGKPVVALTTGMMTSGAYWAAAAANRVLLASPITLTGSIGTVLAHVDFSAREEAQGIKVTEITAGKFKLIASEHRPLSEAGREELQRIVDAVNDAFVSDVARFRGVSGETIRKLEARILVGEEGIAAGLADGMATVDQAVSELVRSNPSVPATSSRPALVPPAKRSPIDAQRELERAAARYLDSAVAAASGPSTSGGNTMQNTQPAPKPAPTIEQIRARAKEIMAEPRAGARVEFHEAVRQATAELGEVAVADPFAESDEERSNARRVAEAQELASRARAYQARMAEAGVAMQINEAVRAVLAGADRR